MTRLLLGKGVRVGPKVDALSESEYFGNKESKSFIEGSEWYWLRMWLPHGRSSVPAAYGVLTYPAFYGNA